MTDAVLICLLQLAFVEDPAIEQARESLSLRLESLQNVTVEYEKTEVFRPLHPRSDDGGNRSGLFRRSNTTSYDCEFRYLRGLLMISGSLLSTSSPQPGDEQERQIVLARDRYERLWLDPGAQFHHGIIRDTGLRPDSEVVDLALGLAAAYGVGWVQPSDFGESEVQLEIDGQLWHVAWHDDKGRQHLWDYDLEGTRLLKYEVYAPAGWLHIRLENEDFQDTNGFLLPMSTTKRTYHERNGERFEVVTRTIRVKEYIIDDERNRESDFRITWPAGSRVLDARTHGTTTSNE